jgi:hypothetical protein
MIDKLKQPLDSQFGRGRRRDTLSEPEHYARTPDELGHKTVQKIKLLLLLFLDLRAFNPYASPGGRRCPC